MIRIQCVLFGMRDRTFGPCFGPRQGGPQLEAHQRMHLLRWLLQGHITETNGTQLVLIGMRNIRSPFDSQT
jgi:hypothetical protein